MVKSILRRNPTRNHDLSVSWTHTFDTYKEREEALDLFEAYDKYGADTFCTYNNTTSFGTWQTYNNTVADLFDTQQTYNTRQTYNT